MELVHQNFMSINEFRENVLICFLIYLFVFCFSFFVSLFHRMCFIYFETLFFPIFTLTLASISSQQEIIKKSAPEVPRLSLNTQLMAVSVLCQVPIVFWLVEGSRFTASKLQLKTFKYIYFFQNFRIWHSYIKCS